jgi:hypothetical protein
LSNTDRTAAIAAVEAVLRTDRHFSVRSLLVRGDR